MEPIRLPDQRRVVITTPPSWLSGLETSLAHYDVNVRRHPLLEIEAAPVPDLLRHGSPASYGGIICNSPRAAILLRLATAAHNIAAMPRIWCVGAATAAVLAGSGLATECLEGEYGDPLLVTATLRQIIGSAVSGPLLLLLGEPDLPDLASRLHDAGQQVVAVPAFTTRPVSDVELIAALDQAELLVVANSDVVVALAAQGEDALLPVWVAIGRRCADRCRAAGLSVVATAEDCGLASVVKALTETFATRFHLQPRDGVSRNLG